MEELILFDSNDFIRITAKVENDPTLPSDGDTRISVWVKSSNFESKNDVWVQRDAFVAFCKELVNLENLRRGSARLKSISPGELNIVIQAISAPGHMSVGGICGYPVYRPHGLVFHRLEFGFEFDPSQLLAAVGVSWVRHYAA